MQNLVVWIGSWWPVVIPGSGHCRPHRTVVADSSPCLGFFLPVLGFQLDVYKSMGGRTQLPASLHSHGGAMSGSLCRELLEQFIEDSKGRVSLKEVTGLGGWWTQPSPALQGGDLAWRRLLIPPLAALVFYPISTWINRSGTASAARLRICQHSPGS